jgi:hypothetical protein
MAVEPIEFYADPETDEAERLRVSAEWQKVMALHEGRRVLGYILRDLGLFSTVGGERSAGKHEAAIALVDQMRAANNGLFLAIITELLSDENPSQD